VCRLPTLCAVPGESSLSSVEAHSSLDSIAPEWDDLADRAGAAPFLRPGWFLAFADAFGSTALEALTVRRHGRLVGVAPLDRAGGVLRSLTNWHTPEFAFVAEDEAAVQALAEAVCDRWDGQVALWFVNPTNPDYEVCRGVARARARRVVTRTLERPPYVAVDREWRSFETGVDAKLRRDLRRRRRLLEAQGKPSFEVLDGTEGLDALLAEGFGVEGSGWKAEQGTAIVSRAETRRFYTEIARWAAPRGWLRLAFLRLGGRPLAFHYGLEDGQTYYLLKGGYDPEYRRFAPGKLLVAFMIERAFAENLEKFDFGGEDEPFKAEWASGHRELVLLQLFAPSVRGLIEWTAYAYGRPVAKRVVGLVRR
jgi:CelD/BcsL family acetyltransferase involved in cellulose biosynthesis